MSQQVEVEVLEPMWHEAKPIEIKEGQPLPVISLPRADAVYLQGIGRVRILESEEEAKPAKPGKVAKGK